MTSALLWKENWGKAKENLIKWWKQEGMAISLVAERSTPRLIMQKPIKPIDLDQCWIDPIYRCDVSEYYMVSHDYLAEAFPYFDTQVGPGTLGIILGAKPTYDIETVWYEPCIYDLEKFTRIKLKTVGNNQLLEHIALIDEGLKRSNKRYLVGIPDLIENVDTLAAMRGNEQLLYDLVERPSWVHERLAEINQAYFTLFNILFEKVKDDDGGNAFAAFYIWGPGKTAKLQCDFSAMISPHMFQEFVVPYLSTQCKWLDYSLYHLDGTTALHHLDELLKIKNLNAIEWTPQAGHPGGGSREWYDLYKRIKRGGKSIQAIGVKSEELIPLIDAIGPEGLFVVLDEPAMRLCDAEELLKKIEPYYS